MSSRFKSSGKRKIKDNLEMQSPQRDPGKQRSLRVQGSKVEERRGTQRKSTGRAARSLFVEKARLSGGRGRGFASSDANDAEHGHLGKRSARHEDAIRGGIQVWRRDLETVVKQR